MFRCPPISHTLRLIFPIETCLMLKPWNSITSPIPYRRDQRHSLTKNSLSCLLTRPREYGNHNDEMKRLLTWVGAICDTSSSANFFKIVVFPALSRPEFVGIRVVDEVFRNCWLVVSKWGFAWMIRDSPNRSNRTSLVGVCLKRLSSASRPW